jgi:hypothetical protein
MSRALVIGRSLGGSLGGLFAGLLQAIGAPPREIPELAGLLG